MYSFRYTLSIFLTAVRKELIQQLRTKRFLVILAVFLLLGLASPMLNKVTPELTKLDPDGAKIAELLPVPTAVDALSGYVQMISTFGFILAIIFGMGAIAGEKESGTAAMTLSKPMPRWVFVLSKFTSQLLVYTLAFLVSGMAVYYGTVVLFGPVEVFTVLKIDMLLLLSFITYASMEILASVLGKSIAVAAGIGLGLFVLIGFTRNIPYIGKWTPSGLMVRAVNLAVNADQVTVDPRAIVGTLVLILAFLIASTAIFERQEIG